MTLEEYQKFTKTTGVYPKTPQSQALSYVGLGLVNEAGEVAGVIKKILRNDYETIPLEKIIAELGDVAWYLSEMCNVLNISLVDVLKQNKTKLEDRKERGVIKGSGDNR